MGFVVLFAIALWALLRCICYSPCMGFVVLFAVALWALLCFICEYVLSVSNCRQGIDPGPITNCLGSPYMPLTCADMVC